MIEITPEVERAVLVAAPKRGTRDEQQATDHLNELRRLANTAGAEIASALVQRLHRPSPEFYIGSGKLEELKTTVSASGATVVIFDEELSPAQGKNLERELGIRVMDRAELILDIFATRAKSSEARMQVELAQLEYLLPRLARMWVHLSRIRGGIGLRGPGETQLETDRRMIRKKIGTLKKRIAKYSKHRATIRRGRRPIPTVALVGYTNAGKSSLLRTLTGQEVFVEDRLFATLDTLTREIFVPPRHRLRLVDSVGFIRKLPHHLVASFGATLEETMQADLLLHVVDCSHPEWEEQFDVVEEVLADLQVGDRPVMCVFNKIDRLDDPRAFSDRIIQRFDRAIFTSATTGNVDELMPVFVDLATQYRRARFASSEAETTDS